MSCSVWLVVQQNSKACPSAVACGVRVCALARLSLAVHAWLGAGCMHKDCGAHPPADVMQKSQTWECAMI